MPPGANMFRALRIAFMVVLMLIAAAFAEGLPAALAGDHLTITCPKHGKASVAPGGTYTRCDKCATPFCKYDMGFHRIVQPSSSCTGRLQVVTNPR